MRKRQSISPETVYQSLEPITYDQARVNSGLILRPFENTVYIPATSHVMNDDEFNSIESDRGYYTNTETLKGAERRMHLLGTVTTRTLVVPERLPRKSEQFMRMMLSDKIAKIAVANVSITSMYPIRIKAEHATTVRVPVRPNASSREAAAQGVAAFLNGGEGLLDADAAADFDERLEATRRMAAETKKRTWEFLDNYRQGLRRGRK